MTTHQSKMTANESNNKWGDFNWSRTSIIYSFTAALSTIASTWIMADFLASKWKRSMCYHRLVFGSSFFDLLASFWFCVNTWAQPMTQGFFEDAYDGYTSHEKFTTCRMSGFSIYLGSLSIPWYKAALLIYYYLAVCCEWNEEKIRQNFERYVHFLLGPISAIIATLPIFSDLYHNFYSYCFVVFVAGNKVLLSYVLQFISVASTILSTCVMVTVVVLMSKSAMKKNNKRRAACKVALKMAFGYTAAFLFTWSIPITWLIYVQFSFIMSRTNLNPLFSYIMTIYIAVFLPLHGFLTWVVYLQPRFQRLRKSKVSTCKLVKDTFLGSCSGGSGDAENMESFEHTGSFETDEENPISSNNRDLCSYVAGTGETALPLFIDKNSNSDSDSSVITYEDITTSCTVDGISSTVPLPDQDSSLTTQPIIFDEEQYTSCQPTRTIAAQTKSNSNSADELSDGEISNDTKQLQAKANSSDQLSDDNISYDVELRQVCEQLSLSLYPQCNTKSTFALQ
mmetsp:Transcript_2873/g.4330  ORF Transcript_2873/g.4330 Transcript_2873/m.4330 type:complete len:509 (+) Transcript_2873:53-1579(+)